MLLTDNIKGALLMMGSMAAFTLNDTFFKTLSGEVPLFQGIFLRGCLVVVLMSVLAFATGDLRRPIPAGDRKVIALRTLGEMGATICFLTALFHMPLANVTAILQSLPLFITLVGALLFGEQVGWRRWGAIIIGLFGVLLIVRPGGEGFDRFSLLALAAVGFVVLRDLSTRRLSPGTPSLSVALVGAVAITLMGGMVSATSDWVPLEVYHYKAIAAASLFIIFGYTLSVMVMRIGEIAVVTPFRYTAMVWAILLGYLVFGDIPGPLTLVGSAIVVGMGIYTFYRERQLARQNH